MRDCDKVGMTVSYWRDLEAIWRWKEYAEHVLVQRPGQARWYKAYRVRVSRVERESIWHAAEGVTVPEPIPDTTR